MNMLFSNSAKDLFSGNPLSLAFLNLQYPAFRLIRPKTINFWIDSLVEAFQKFLDKAQSKICR
ncbi:hypothetical protein BIU88_04910 [Chlorobaculum limnaeum]|uniref:Uncharacterized protein n=1 Tax=Chlorobaculum limnaeum TaxID=274537 RepID=A0A1D8CX89_CHLLM|nr:hypothetical protein BIU88_04910 [Chlorobaculum limnaeum]